MNHLSQNRRQRGITLVMALLLTSAVIASSLIVASILVRELRLTDNMRQSLVAYYGAESGLESALYEYYQDGGNISTVAGTAGAVADWSISSGGNTSETLETTLARETSQEIPLYEVVDPFTPFDVQTITISWASRTDVPENIEYTFLTKPASGLTPGPRGLKVDKGIESAAGVSRVVIDLPTVLGSLSPADLRIFRFKHIGLSGADEVAFSVTMTDSAGDPVAFNQETALKVTGTTTGSNVVSRALTVGIDPKPSAYDVFDYVIFSDSYVSRDFTAAPTATATPKPSITLIPISGTIVRPSVIRPSAVGPTATPRPVITVRP